MNKPLTIQDALKQTDIHTIFLLFEKIPVNFSKNNTQKRPKNEAKKLLFGENIWTIRMKTN